MTELREASGTAEEAAEKCCLIEEHRAPAAKSRIQFQGLTVCLKAYLIRTESFSAPSSAVPLSVNKNKGFGPWGTGGVLFNSLRDAIRDASPQSKAALIRRGFKVKKRNIKSCAVSAAKLSNMTSLNAPVREGMKV
jgi:hypothetical protein